MTDPEPFRYAHLVRLTARGSLAPPPDRAPALSPDPSASAAENRRRLDRDKASRIPLLDPSPFAHATLLPTIPTSTTSTEIADRPVFSTETRRPEPEALRLVELETCTPQRRSPVLGPSDLIRRRVLAVTGYDDGAHRFGAELSSVRDNLPEQFWHVIEHNNVRVGELTTFLEDEQPEILHICAHSDLAGIHFAHPVETHTYPVTRGTVVRAITMADVDIPWIVLSWCDSYTTAQEIVATGGTQGVVCWKGPTSDRRCHELTATLYRHLCRHDLPTAFARARSELDDEALVLLLAPIPRRPQPRTPRRGGHPQ